MSKSSHLILRIILFVFAVAFLFVIPFAVSSIYIYGFNITAHAHDIDYLRVFKFIYSSLPLPALLDVITGAFFAHNLSDITINDKLFLLAMGLPTEMIVQNLLELIGIISKKPLGRIGSDGKYRANTLVNIFAISICITCFVCIKILYDTYANNNIILIAIVVISILIWLSWCLAKRFRGYPFIKSILFDLLDSILELPIITIITMLMFVSYSNIAANPIISAGCIVAMLVLLWLYCKPTIFHNVILWYLFKILCFVVCIFLYTYLRNTVM